VQALLPAVRKADPSDEKALMAMCRRLHAENGLFSFSDRKVRTLIQQSFDMTAPYILGVIGPKNPKDGDLQASICCMITDFYYTDDIHLAELWNFVERPFRRSHNAKALIEYAKQIAKDQKLPFFTGIITNQQMAGKVRLYQQMLDNPVGAFFLWNAHWKTDPIEDHAELCHRLKIFAERCATKPRTVTSAIAQQEIAPVLREAAMALAADSLWGAKTAAAST
jgi:hypothetical protein